MHRRRLLRNRGNSLSGRNRRTSGIDVASRSCFSLCDPQSGTVEAVRSRRSHRAQSRGARRCVRLRGAHWSGLGGGRAGTL